MLAATAATQPANFLNCIGSFFFLVNLMSALFQVFHFAGRQSGMKKRSRLVPFFGSLS